MVESFNDESITEPILAGTGSTEKISDSFPTQIGPYKIESLLQRGGMSVIYLGSDPKTKEPVIVKVLLSKFLNQPDVVDRFFCEAEILALADHTHIVKMYSNGEWAGGYYIAMEFVTGISMRQYILQTPLSLKHSLELLLEIAYALCHLHARGIIHRDVKPENVLVTEEGHVKLIDFGIAQMQTDHRTVSTIHTHRMIGTPIYMSPEQRENPEIVSYPSDIYSLGIIAYELVLGKLSHGHLHLSLMPKGLQKILNKALQPKAEERYQDIVDLISDVSCYLSSDNLERETRASDRLFNFYESLKQAQASLFPDRSQKLPNIDFGASVHIGEGLAGLYGELLPFKNNQYLLLLGECLTSSAQGLIAAAMFKGMVHALIDESLSAQALLLELNIRLFKAHPHCSFALCCLLIDMPAEQVQFISYGYGTLWMIPKEVIAPRRIITYSQPLGRDAHVKVNEIEGTWAGGDQIVIYGAPHPMGGEVDPIDSLIQHGLIEYAGMPPQNQTEAILRKIKLSQTLPPAKNLFIIKICRC